MKIKLYHGTNSKFDKFDMSYFGKTDEGYYGIGFYFTTDFDYAKEYGRYVYSCNVTINNPFVMLTDSSDDSNCLLEVRKSISQLNGFEYLKPNFKLPEGYRVEEEKVETYGKIYTVYSIYPNEVYYGTDKEIYGKQMSTIEQAIVSFNDTLNGNDFDCGWVSALTRKIGRDKLSDTIKNAGFDAIQVTDYKSKSPVEYIIFDNRNLEILDIVKENYHYQFKYLKSLKF